MRLFLQSLLPAADDGSQHQHQQQQQGTLDLRVASIPIILGAGLLGSLVPLFLKVGGACRC